MFKLLVGFKLLIQGNHIFTNLKVVLNLMEYSEVLQELEESLSSKSQILPLPLDNYLTLFY